MKKKISDRDQDVVWSSKPPGGIRILALHADEQDIELYGEVPGKKPLACVVLPRGALSRVWDPYQFFYDSLSEAIESFWPEFIYADIRDVHPEYAESIAALAKELAEEKTDWNASENDPWAWAWERTFHFGIALPTRLSVPLDIDTPSNEH